MKQFIINSKYRPVDRNFSPKMTKFSITLFAIFIYSVTTIVFCFKVPDFGYENIFRIQFSGPEDILKIELGGCDDNLISKRVEEMKKNVADLKAKDPNKLESYMKCLSDLSFDIYTTEGLKALCLEKEKRDEFVSKVKPCLDKFN